MVWNFGSTEYNTHPSINQLYTYFTVFPFSQSGGRTRDDYHPIIIIGFSTHQLNGKLFLCQSAGIRVIMYL